MQRVLKDPNKTVCHPASHYRYSPSGLRRLDPLRLGILQLQTGVFKLTSGAAEENLTAPMKAAAAIGSSARLFGPSIEIGACLASQAKIERGNGADTSPAFRIHFEDPLGPIGVCGAGRVSIRGGCYQPYDMGWRPRLSKPKSVAEQNINDKARARTSVTSYSSKSPASAIDSDHEHRRLQAAG